MLKLSVGTFRAILVTDIKGVIALQSQRSLASGAPTAALASVIKRKHVTSTRHSAEATLTPEAAFENLGSLKKLKPERKSLQLPPNIKFSYCPPQYLTLPGGVSKHYEAVEAAAQTMTVAKRPLVLLFAWMLSQDKHIEKYRHFWYQRGFDVLTVRTAPLDLLLPTVGGARIARTLVDYLQCLRPRYDEIVVHAFSVGGYQLCEFLRQMERSMAEGDVKVAQLSNSFRGWIIDSCVFANDCAPGLSRAITTNPIVQPAIEQSIHTWLKATRSFTLDRYVEVQSYLSNNRRRVPALVLYSEDDIVSSVDINRDMVAGWQKSGVATRSKCWPKSVHVMHYKEHQQEYEHLVDHFLGEVTHLTKNIPNKQDKTT